jgi:hypothetical protein
LTLIEMGGGFGRLHVSTLENNKVKKVRKTSFEIYASRECIDNSERNSLHWCIFALAIIYSIRGAQHVQVDKKETRFTFQGFRYIFPTPIKSAIIAESYDRGVMMKRDIVPWRDTLKEPISIEPSQHRRPSQKKKREKVKRSRSCTSRRSTRWNGRKI